MEQDFIVTNRLGIHARVAAKIVTLASQFDCDLWFAKDGNKVSGKSVLDLMTLMCPKGCTVKVSADGRDAAQVLDALAALFRTKFGEA